ncbi:MAG TPA: FeoA family protein [bacterium]|nr:FeoA family protein [bacterium]
MTGRENILDTPVHLGELRKGEGGHVCKVEGPEKTVRRLLEMGLIEESYVEVVHEAPFGRDPIAVRVRGGLLGLRRQEAACILLRKASRP